MTPWYVCDWFLGWPADVVRDARARNAVEAVRSRTQPDPRVGDGSDASWFLRQIARTVEDIKELPAWLKPPTCPACAGVHTTLQDDRPVPDGSVCRVAEPTADAPWGV